MPRTITSDPGVIAAATSGKAAEDGSAPMPTATGQVSIAAQSHDPAVRRVIHRNLAAKLASMISL